METCVFVGPTLAHQVLPADIARFGPAALGSIVRAVEAGHRRIGLIDGLFGAVPAVWHKEILYAMSHGVEVVGAASMGALRAAELHAFGMVGVGRCFRMFRSGAWTDDDEVALIHATKAFGYAPLSEPMANIRFTLRALRRDRTIGPETERALVAGMKALHFSQRTLDELRRRYTDLVDARAGEGAMRRFDAGRIDIKQADARLLIDYLRDPTDRRPAQAPCAFASTVHWRMQFERQAGDVPPLH